MKFILSLALLCSSAFAIAQQANEHISFKVNLEDEIIELDKPYYSEALQDSVTFEAIRFYISNVQFFQGESLVTVLEKTHHLIDLEDTESMQIALMLDPDLAFNKIRFNLGIDSLTNVSGAFGGDLDPSNGMYWTWQSGYINFKLEGISKACPARKNRFQFHLGGYQAPANSLQEITLSLDMVEAININLAIEDFFKKINLKETYQVMSPNEQAVEMAQLVASVFSISK